MKINKSFYQDLIVNWKYNFIAWLGRSWLGIIYYYILNRFIHKSHLVILSNKGKFRDVHYKIEEALEVLFFEFWKNDYAIADWNWNDSVKDAHKIIKEIHHYFTVEQHELQKQYDISMDRWSDKRGFKSGSGKDWLENINKPMTSEEKILLNKTTEAENAIYARRTEILTKIINIRGSLWS